MLRMQSQDRTLRWVGAARRVLGVSAVLILVAVAAVALLLPPLAEADGIMGSRHFPGEGSPAEPAPGPRAVSLGPAALTALGSEPRSGGAPPAAPGFIADSRCGKGDLKDKVNLNLAGVEELDRLPGIGPTKAHRIVAWRLRNGPFRRIKDLRRVKGFGRKTVIKLAPHLTVDRPTSKEIAGAK